MKNNTETRALLDALCAWLVEDAKFMPAYVDRLRDRFDALSGGREKPRDKHEGAPMKPP